MGMSEKRAQFIELVDFLKGMGHEPLPKKSTGRYRWYRSPFRAESDASFTIDTKYNRWIDFGMEALPGSGNLYAGGRVLEFLMVYYNCDREAAISRLDVGDLTFVSPAKAKAKEEEDEGFKNVLLSAHPIRSQALIDYLSSRHIPLHVASRICCEVDFEFNGKKCFGLGFKNNFGGYEIRNKFIKTCTKPKGITCIDNGARTVAVFEGFFDYMSFVAMYGEYALKAYNYCILNSAAFISVAFDFLESHDRALLLLDNDNTGLKYRLKALARNEQCGGIYKHAGKFFSPFKDLNEWHVNEREKLRKNPRQHL